MKLWVVPCHEVPSPSRIEAMYNRNMTCINVGLSTLKCTGSNVLVDGLGIMNRLILVDKGLTLISQEGMDEY